jgi:hypothetical protein
MHAGVSAGVCCCQVGYKIAAGEYWRLLTAAFVHGNVLHVGVRAQAYRTTLYGTCRRWPSLDLLP